MTRDTLTNGGSETPLDFFRSLAEADAPWPEPLVWESFTREQAFTASCDASGHVELIITLRETDRLGEKTTRFFSGMAKPSAFHPVPPGF